MLQMDVIRGPHSTGVTAVSLKNVYVVKGLQLPTQLIHNPRYIDNVDHKYKDIFCYMGHNRWATEGAVTRRNAHPFQHGHITMMHNGTLYWKMDTGQFKFDTDSEGICWNIQQKGIDETWKGLSGAACLVWWDSQQKTLNIITNGLRPMNMSMSEDGKNMLWASEPWMLRAAADRRNIKLSPNLAIPAPNMLFTFKHDKDGVTWESRRLAPYTYVVREYKGNGRQNWSFGRNHAVDDWDDDWNNPRLWDKLHEAEEKAKQEAATKKVIDLRPKTSCVSVIATRFDPETSTMVPVTDSEAFNRLLPVPVIGNPPANSESMDRLKSYMKVGLSSEEFDEKYKTCVSCGDSLAGQREEAVIIDDRYAVCETCVAVCENEDLSIHQLVKGGK